jgi:hypothetical protein
MSTSSDGWTRPCGDGVRGIANEDAHELLQRAVRGGGALRAARPHRHRLRVRHHAVRHHAPGPRLHVPVTARTSQRPLTWPIAGRLTSGFGRRGFWSWHGGVDIVARRVTPIRAAADGTVQFSGWQSSCGAGDPHRSSPRTQHRVRSQLEELRQGRGSSEERDGDRHRGPLRPCQHESPALRGSAVRGPAKPAPVPVRADAGSDAASRRLTRRRNIAQPRRRDDESRCHAYWMRSR